MVLWSNYLMRLQADDISNFICDVAAGTAGRERKSHQPTGTGIIISYINGSFIVLKNSSTIRSNNLFRTVGLRNNIFIVHETLPVRRDWKGITTVVTVASY